LRLHLNLQQPAKWLVELLQTGNKVWQWYF
jgi:hypothetical protein